MQIEMVDCTDCAGKGYIYHKRMYGGNCTALVVWECVLCQGIGKIPQSVGKGYARGTDFE